MFFSCFPRVTRGHNVLLYFILQKGQIENKQVQPHNGKTRRQQNKKYKGWSTGSTIP